MNKPVAVLGAGIWGCALAILLANNQQTVYLWDTDTLHIKNLQNTGFNHRHFPTIPLPKLIHPTLEFSDVLSATQDILVVVPSHAFTDLMHSLKSLLTNEARIAWATKGLDPKTSRFFHEIVEEILGSHIPTAVLSGPSFAKEVAEGKPTHILLASQNYPWAQDLFSCLHNTQFKVEHSQDLIGTQLCGALKNVLAIAIGMSDGLKLGANARCALITSALNDMAELGQALGAKPQTIYGLAGLGDVILTCTDDQSRNRRFGFALGQGKTIETAEQEIAQTIEGKITTFNAYQLIQQKGLSCHFIQELHKVFSKQTTAKEAIFNLLLL